MNELLKSSLFTFLIFALALSCSSKKNDPVLVTSTDPGCMFTFKGNTYSSTTVTCSLGHLSSSGGTGTFAWVLTMEPGNGDVSLQINDGTYETDNSTLMQKDDIVTFDITLQTLTNDKGEFKGKCGCSTGDL
jgi:hypothetical protein